MIKAITMDSEELRNLLYIEYPESDINEIEVLDTVPEEEAETVVRELLVNYTEHGINYNDTVDIIVDDEPYYNDIPMKVLFDYMKDYGKTCFGIILKLTEEYYSDFLPLDTARSANDITKTMIK